MIRYIRRWRARRTAANFRAHAASRSPLSASSLSRTPRTARTLMTCPCGWLLAAALAAGPALAATYPAPRAIIGTQEEDAMSIMISYAELEGWACEDQRELFRKLFGDNLVLHSKEEAEALAREHAAVFDWQSAAANLLPLPRWEQYETAVATLFASLLWEARSGEQP